MVKHHNYIHGESGNLITPEYRAWLNMKKRCYNSTFTGYKNHGARGIIVCDEWKNDFEQFLSDMGRKPSQEYSLERKDNNGNYKPNNCKWATRTEQNKNRRPMKRFIRIEKMWG